MSLPATRTQPTTQLHVTFGASAAGSLTMALRQMGRDRDRIAYHNTPLYLGPIAPAAPRARLRWFDEDLEWWTDSDAFAHDEAFWQEVVPDVDPIVWMSRRSARELCGLLELLWRRRRPVRVIDVADIPFVGAGGSPGTRFAIVSHERIVECGLLERARELSPSEVDAHVASWQRLKDDGRPMRVVSSAGLSAVPLTHFDDAIVAAVPTEWTRCPRVVGDVLGRLFFAHDIGDIFVFERLRALVCAGRVEGQGDLSSFRASSVRRATPTHAR